MSRVSFLTACLFFAGLLPGLADDCRPISSDRIFGRDLSAAAPELAGIAPDRLIGFAPAPGVERVFPAGQLERLAKTTGLIVHVRRAVCFAWPMHPLTKAEMLTAMQRSLPPGAQVQIVDQLKAPVPNGVLEFPAQRLVRGSEKSSTWGGYVIYAPGRRFSTWARVNIRIHEDHLIAAREIRDGEIIGADAFRTESYEGPLLHADSVTAPSQIIGKLARTPIHEGAILTADLFTAAPDVEKDQVVTVYVSFGGAHVETQGIASERGYRGDTIRIRNPKTGRVFRARINGPNSATVVVGNPSGLVVEGDKKS